MAKLPWAYNVILLEKVKNSNARTWYACTALEESWSRNVLALLLRGPEDQSSIGLLLCRSRDHVQVEYAPRDMAKPIGVAEWETQIVEKLPEELKGSLPTEEEIEAELGVRGPRRGPA